MPAVPYPDQFNTRVFAPGDRVRTYDNMGDNLTIKRVIPVPPRSRKSVGHIHWYTLSNNRAIAGSLVFAVED